MTRYGGPNLLLQQGGLATGTYKGTPYCEVVQRDAIEYGFCEGMP
jgi:hypothetical protein